MKSAPLAATNPQTRTIPATAAQPTAVLSLATLDIVITVHLMFLYL